MKLTLSSLMLMLAVSSFFYACNNGTSTAEKNAGDTAQALAGTQGAPNIKEDAVSYKADTTTLNSFVVYDENKTGARPAVLVVPEWWGLNDYPRMRAKKLAELGYIAMAVDMYGNGKVAANPKDAMTMATPYYKNPQLAKTFLDAAMSKLREYKQTDTGNIAAIGYCFGGYIVLNAAKLGADLKGVVSFHGSLAGVAPSKDLLKAKVLVCHGEADKFESPQEIAAFKKGMDSVGADYTFKTYPNATHAFTNPQATETGKKFSMPIEYNAAADTASWNDMKTFFGTIFRQ